MNQKHDQKDNVEKPQNKPELRELTDSEKHQLAGGIMLTSDSRFLAARLSAAWTFKSRGISLNHNETLVDDAA